MKRKFKIISEDLQKNLIEFLDEVQFEAAKTKDEKESMHVINFCSWAIKELIESYYGCVQIVLNGVSLEDFLVFIELQSKEDMRYS